MDETISGLTDSSEALARTLLRYNRAGPRYTSYPPANHFHDGVGPEDYARALAQASDGDLPLSLYVHLPFCHRRCTYCGCFSLPGPGSSRVDAYLDHLEAEIEGITRHLGHRRRLTQLQWGGGTPNYLEPGQLERCAAMIFDRFELAPEAEVGIEIDPASVTQLQLETVRQLGFNRVSLGVQDLDERVQRAIGRGQTEAQTQEVFAACRQLGFGSINLDLVYGLPGQSRDSLRTTLDKVIELRPDRLALFGFAFLPGLRPNQRHLRRDDIPGAEDRAVLYADAVAHLTGAGYQRIGMDHFAEPSDELARAQAQGRLHRNFQGYTARAAADIVALGPSAISDIGGCYAQNSKDLEAYTAAVTSGELATARGFVLSDEDRLRREVITTLMCNLRVSFPEIEARFPEAAPFAEHFALELERLGELVDGGVLTIDEKELRLAPEAWPLVRLAAMAFDAYLPRTDSPDGPRYSAII